METRIIRNSVLAALLTAFSAAHAATDATDKATPGSALNPQAAPAGPAAGAAPVEKESWLDGMRMGRYTEERDILRKQLTGATSVDELRERLSRAGFMTTSINEQSDDEVEYEVVKGDHSYELSAEKERSGMLKDIEVSNNLWRADETKRAMQDAGYKPGDVTYDKSVGNKFRDKQYLSSWNDEKEALEAALVPGKPMGDYQKILEDKGYRVTSMNDADTDSMEFEIVKGQQSYEVQLEADNASNIVKSVDVTTNMWQSKETERALGQE